MTDKREELIDVLVERPQHKISGNSQGGCDCRCGARWDWQKSEKEAAERHAAGYLADRLIAVFERARTPTDDERGWSTADRREALAEAQSRFTLSPDADGKTRRWADGCVNGFLLGAEWWKSRRTVQGEPRAFEKRHADHEHVGPYCMPQAEPTDAQPKRG